MRPALTPGHPPEARYGFGRHALQLRSGYFGRDLDYARITGVRSGRDRRWWTLSFAFDPDWMTLEYPSRFGGYSLSAKERELFLRLLAERRWGRNRRTSC